MRRGQEQVVLGTARALATALNERPELFDEGTFGPARRSENLYVYPIYYALGLDDNTLTDWGDYQRYELSYGRANTIATPLNPQSEFSRYYHNDESLNFKLLVGEHNRFLYAYINVVDNNVVYRAPDSLSIHRSDFVQISMSGPDGELRRYVVSPRGPEFIYAYEIGSDLRDIGSLRHEERISGQWYENLDGYTIELRMPLTMLGSKLGFAVYDVDDPATRNVTAVVATSNVNDIERLGAVQRPTPEIDKIVEGMGYTDSRIQVVDRTRRVLLSVGDIQSATGLSLTSPQDDEERNRNLRILEDKILHPIYYQILTKPSNDFIDELYVGSRLEGAHLSSALGGE
ncbi:MAG: proteobacterial dedicated sortase system histidine kinase, partial [Pseudohongiella sp.]|nr:proteobacterial dedicated sortase system histidine kinase [Pseudohongiella sp.]